MAGWSSAASIVSLLATIAVALLLIGIGRVVERLSPTGVSELAAPAAWLITGWAVAALVGALCAAGGIGLAWPAALLGVTGMGGYCIGVPRGPLLKLAAAWLIVAPLLLIASTIPPTMFDEFAQWLPNTRFLVEHGRFPDAAAPNIWSAKPAYPPAIPIIGYAVQTVSGHGAELAAKIFSVLLAASFGLTLAGLVRTRLGLPLALAVGVAFATVADPFFDPRVSLTAYADAPTGFVLALLVYICWQVLDEPGQRGTWPAVGACVLLVLLRETNIVLVAGVGGAVALAGPRGRRLCAAMAIGSTATFLLWRGYIAAAAMPPSLAPRAFAAWRWDAPWLVAKSLITERLGNNPLAGGGVFLLLVLVVAVLVYQRHMFRRLHHLYRIVGAVAGLWVLFLLWSYIAVFNADEIRRAASAWRYLSQLGPTLILVCFAVVTASERFRWTRSVPAVLGVLACMLPGLAIIATRSHWRIDGQYPMTARLHAVAPALAPVIGTDRLTVLHPVDAASAAAEIDYDLHRAAGSSSADAESADGYLLDITGLENGRCPRLRARSESGWREVLTTSLGC